MDMLAIFRGVTTPVSDLARAIQEQGWQLGMVKYENKLGAYTAEVISPHGESLTKTGPDEGTAVSNALLAVTRRNHMRTTAQFKVGMWRTNWHERQREIAEAYRDAPIYDPKAVAAYKALADDSMHRLHVLGGQLHIEPTNDPQPYKSAEDMRKDVHDKRHYYLTRAGAAHPVWTADQVAAFRAVHDILGHGVAGGEYDWPGRVLAAHAHAPLLDPTAQQALFSEAVARPAFLHTYGAGPQKVALFPDFVEHQQGENNPGAHTGIHPSQTTAPIAPAEGFANYDTISKTHAAQSRSNQRVQDDGVQRSSASWLPGELDGGAGLTSPRPQEQASEAQSAEPGWDSLSDVEATRSGATEVRRGMQELPRESDRDDLLGKTANWGNTVDANQGFESGVDPLPVNGYIHHGDPLQAKATMDNARLVDTGWSKFQKGDGSDDRERMKQAIVNAFRVVLLSPRKDLRWNAIHYQDIANVPGGVDDPKVYWDTLEKSRRKWNEAQGIDPESHMVFYKFLKPFEARIAANHPEKGWEWAKEEAKQTLFNWWTEEQERIQAEDSKKPADKQRHADEIERRANEALARRMQLFLKPKDDKLDVEDGQLSMLGGAAHENELPDILQELIRAGEGPAPHQKTPYEIELDKKRAEERAFYDRDPQGYYHKMWGGEGDITHPFHSQFVEWVPIQHVLPYAEWKRNPAHGAPAGESASQDYWDILKNHIRENGIKNPIQLRINPDDSMGHIAEGNHRLAVADALGMTHVPMSVYVSRRRGNSQAPVPGYSREATRYREDLKPSDVGFPVQKTAKIAAVGGYEVREPGPHEPVYNWDGREFTPQEHYDKMTRPFQFLNVYHQGNPVGTTMFRIEKGVGETIPPRVNWESVFVHPDHRGQGAFRELWNGMKGIAPYDVLSNSWKNNRLREWTVNQNSRSKTAAGGQYNLLTGQEALKYGAFMGTHLKAISQVSQHVDELLDAALEDVRQHDAQGHHFRHAVLQLGISGVGPKVCSFAWLLLQPLTSQLATIDTHMMDVLGHDYEKDMNNRDYFKFERQFRAGLDAAGYTHLPLGAGQWGMWDYKRTGPGSHQDHSAMRVLDPTPHSEVDWVDKTVNLKGESWHKQAPDWWQYTQPARDAAGSDWDSTYGKEFAQNQIPYQDLGTTASTKRSYDEGFSYYWDRSMPVGVSLESKARTLAEHAKAAKLSEDTYEDWLDDHKKDTRLSDTEFKRFKKKSLSKFDRLSKTAGDPNNAGPRPSMIHPETLMVSHGMPGQSLMEHARLETGLSTQDVWRLLADEHVHKT